MPSKSHAKYEPISRMEKAKKIISVLSEFTDLKNSTVLDIGTGSGHIAREMAKYCRKTYSVDVVDERKAHARYNFSIVQDENLPFSDGFFDIVISNHAVEHIQKQYKHFSEIYRVLKKGGILYLATPNKKWIIDPHYKLPFISYMPRRLSSLYLRLTKGEIWDIYPLTYSKIKKLAKEKFALTNMTYRVIKNPRKYALKIPKQLSLILKFMPSLLLCLIPSPTLIIILKKKRPD